MQAVRAERRYIQVIRTYDAVMQVGGRMPDLDGVHFYMSQERNDDWRIILGNRGVVRIRPDLDEGYYDIFIGERFTHTCAFQKPHTHGILFLILTERSHIRIAESPVSMCVPAYALSPKETKRSRRSSSLRISVLRETVTKEHKMNH